MRDTPSNLVKPIELPTYETNVIDWSFKYCFKWGFVRMACS